MGNTLILINTVISIILLALVSVILYLQIRRPGTKNKPKEIPSENFSEVLLPVFSFYNGKVHNNGLVSMKLKNSGGKITEIIFIPNTENIEFRCGTDQLEAGQDTTISIVPLGFNFSESYFESNDLLFTIKYKSLLNDFVDEQYKIEDLVSIIKIK